MIIAQAQLFLCIRVTMEHKISNAMFETNQKDLCESFGVWLYWQGLQSHTQNCVCVLLIKRTYLKYVKTIKMILFRFKKNIYRNVSIYTRDRIVLFCFVCKMIMREFKNNFPLSTHFYLRFSTSKNCFFYIQF